MKSRKTKLSSVFTFFKIPCRFLGIDFLQILSTRRVTTNCADKAIHIPFEQFHPLNQPLCLLIAAIRTNLNNILHVGVFLIC